MHFHFTIFLIYDGFIRTQPHFKLRSILRIKNTVTEVKNAFDGHICKLNRAKDRNSELEDVSIESVKTKKEENRLRKTEQTIQRLWDNYKR